MANKVELERAYLMYKSMRPSKSTMPKIAEEFGVSLTTAHKWKNQHKWEERYWAETNSEREAYREEIENRLQDGWRLIDVIRDEMLMKLACKIKDPNYNANLDDLKKIIEMGEILYTQNNTPESNGTSTPNINFQIGFRSPNNE